MICVKCILPRASEEIHATRDYSCRKSDLGLAQNKKKIISVRRSEGLSPKPHLTCNSLCLTYSCSLRTSNPLVTLRFLIPFSPSASINSQVYTMFAARQILGASQRRAFSASARQVGELDFLKRTNHSSLPAHFFFYRRRRGQLALS